MQSSPGTDPQDLSQEELVEELERARNDLAATEERYLRARADLENYRKRADRELERRVRQQGDELLRAWLEVADSLERALALEGEQPASTLGLRAFLEQVESILARQGVRRLGAVGETFDPELHEAVAVVPGTDRPAGTVAEVARSGYAVDDRVVRPAQVAVARPTGDGD
jgi:molecular chaperone GrpE